MSERPTCGACKKVMTPENSQLVPEMFLCDDCAKLHGYSRQQFFRSSATVPEDLAALQKKAADAIMELVREKNIAIENLTREQVASAFLQAIQCGDITRLVVKGTDAQGVVYVPYAREATLRTAIRNAHDLLAPQCDRYCPSLLAIREATRILKEAL